MKKNIILGLFVSVISISSYADNGKQVSSYEQSLKDDCVNRIMNLFIARIEQPHVFMNDIEIEKNSDKVHTVKVGYHFSENGLARIYSCRYARYGKVWKITSESSSPK